MTTPSPPSANPLNTQTVSSPSRTNPPKTQTTPDPEPHQSSKAPDPPYLSFLSAAKNLPRQRRHPGNDPRIPTPARPQTTPPADGPRERRDPGDIRIPLRNLLSVSASPL